MFSVLVTLGAILLDYQAVFNHFLILVRKVID